MKKLAINPQTTKSHFRTESNTAFRIKRTPSWIFMSIVCIISASPLLSAWAKQARDAAFYLPYYDSSTDSFGKGRNDVYYVIGCTIALTVMGTLSRRLAFEPIARHMGLNQAKARRFSEQAWLGLYYLSMWTLGMFIWVRSDYWKETRALLITWPSKQLKGDLKFYLLTSLAFWLNQIFLVHIEERRKDYILYIAHHTATATILWTAYVYGAHDVAHVVSNLMEAADVFLCIAKVLRYWDWRTSGNVALGLFAAVWFATRHVVYVWLLWVLIQDIGTRKAYGCYSDKAERVHEHSGVQVPWAYLALPFVNLKATVCITPAVKWFFLSILISFELMSMFWFGIILKAIIRALNKGYSDDVRSDEDEPSGKE